MERSESIEKLAEALSKAQGELEGAKKGKENPHFKSKYADLDSTWEACRAPLAKHGLSVVQMPFDCEGKIGVETMLMHSSGEWIKGAISVKMVQETNPQNAGSILTYLRRYSLQGAVGIAPEDDDGNAASGKQGPPPQQQEPPPKVDLDPKIVAEFDEAKTFEKMQEVYMGIDANKRRLYTAKKEEARERIAKGAAK
jgi:hypothetical protein